MATDLGGYTANNTLWYYTDTYTTADGTYAWITTAPQNQKQDFEIKWNAIYGSYDDKPKRKGVPMQTLFNIIVVTKDREILLDTKIVAEDEEEAKFSVDIHSILKAKNLKPKDVTVLCNEFGEVKVRKEVQKVKVVDRDEE